MRRFVFLPYLSVIAVVLTVGLACSISTAAPTPIIIVVTATPQPALPTETPAQPIPTDPPVLATTEIPPTLAPSETPTQGAQQFFTEEFNNGTDDWPYFITNGDDSDLNFYTGNSLLSFDISGKNVWAYALYEPFIYDNVRIEVSTANRGNNSNYITLICRYDDIHGWYEFNVTNSGLYHIYFGQWNPGRESASYETLYDGGSNAIHTGTAVNEISVVCDGIALTLYINGSKVRSVNSEFGLTRGQVGIGVSSFNIPVAVDFDWVKISEP